MDDDTRTQAGSLASDTSPLGSADAVEADSSNRVNSDTTREQHLDRPLPPVPVLGGVSEGGIVAGSTGEVVQQQDEGGDTVRTDLGRGDDTADSSEA